MSVRRPHAAPIDPPLLWAVLAVILFVATVLSLALPWPTVGGPPPLLAVVDGELVAPALGPGAGGDASESTQSPPADAAEPVSPDSPPDPAAPARAPAPAPFPAARPTYNGRPLRVQRTCRMVVTGYCPDAQCCGRDAHGITASGYSVWTNGMKLIAADTRLLPFGSLVSIPGYHQAKPVPVLDRGGAIKGQRLDLLFPTHKQAQQWGRKTLTVTVWAYAD